MVITVVLGSDPEPKNKKKSFWQRLKLGCCRSAAGVEEPQPRSDEKSKQDEEKQQEQQQQQEHNKQQQQKQAENQLAKDDLEAPVVALERQAIPDEVILRIDGRALGASPFRASTAPVTPTPQPAAAATTTTPTTTPAKTATNTPAAAETAQAGSSRPAGAEVSDSKGQAGGPETILTATLRYFKASLEPASALEPEDLKREPLVDGFHNFAIALNAIGGSMGSYLEPNVSKLRRSKADFTIESYRHWLYSETPVHAATSYKGYVDDSAWMGNIWITWTIEFFVELFAELEKGQETKVAVDKAYKISLYKHHNFFQRSAFQVAVKSLPERNKLLQELAGSKGQASSDFVLKELSEFVFVGRKVVSFCLKVNLELEDRLKRERELHLKR